MININKLNLKGHLLTAISYLIPIVCGAGFLIAIGMALGGKPNANLEISFSLWDAMAVMGAAGLGLLPVIISTGISYSIAAKPGIAPGFIIGLTAKAISAGFIGGILGGYIAGWLVLAILRYIKVPHWAKGLMPTLIIPFIASLVGGLVMIYVIGEPIALLSGIDFGGPINKTVFAFALTMQAEGLNETVTALQLVNTATPIGFGLAYFIAKMIGKNIYSTAEVETLKSAVPMGVVNIVEGVIPLVMNDIIRSIIATGIGGFAGGATAMILGADAKVPFGGFLMIPTMSKPWAGIIAILVNVVVTGLVLAIIKKNISKENLDEVIENEEEDISLDDIKIL